METSTKKIGDIEFTFKKPTKKEADLFEQKWELDAYISALVSYSAELGELEQRLYRKQIKPDVYLNLRETKEQMLQSIVRRRWGPGKNGVTKPTIAMAHKLEQLVVEPKFTADEWLERTDFDIVSTALVEWLMPMPNDKFKELRSVFEESPKETWKVSEILAQFKIIEESPPGIAIEKNSPGSEEEKSEESQTPSTEHTSC